MTSSIRCLRLFLHSPTSGRKLIGYLSQYGDILRVTFTENYVKDENHQILSLSYIGANESATKEILTAARDVRLSRGGGKWPAYFQNLLPEGGNRDRLAAQRGCTTDDEFELLAAAGRDLLGAIEVEPVLANETIPDVVRDWHTEFGLDVLELGSVEPPLEDASALPGIVTKFSAVLEQQRYVVNRHGRASSHILKLPTARHPDLVANEFMGFQLCKAVGLTCANASVISREDAELPENVPFHDILAVERFDRSHGGQRVHMEEFAQVLGYDPNQKYGKGLEADYSAMLRVIQNLSARPTLDVQEFINRFVTFILMGNTDAHLKNWAVCYPDGRQAVLAPLYDPVCVTAFFEGVPPQDYAINRTIDKTVRAFSWSDLEALLAKAKVERPQRVLQVAKGVVANAKADWPELLKGAPDDMARAVSERLAGGVALA
ncbi:regulator [Massilia sp. WF1]|uniref:type II toxin-antitoxin system HipA family toxin n=1 Tax=unclassified Massilia TaxID=2609279 RepID=UPI0006498E0C|nr:MULTISPECIES: HipA domain-containing protein [unclassified Massilia]ALK96238.1 regulator [Massilia sp. WG5]KLU36213.1 regulator [Massilia sp. WF1]